MSTYHIKYDWSLDSSQLIDIIIIQWHTPLLLDCGSCKPLDKTTVKTKYSFLDNFKEILVHLDKNKPIRPVFIITPELSLPKDCDDRVSDILAGLNRSTVFIGGIEYLKWDEYEKVLKKFKDMPEPDEWLKGGNCGSFVSYAPNGYYMPSYAYNALGE